MSLSRRNFLKTLASGAVASVAGCERHSEHAKITGQIMGSASPEGHRLRKALPPVATKFQDHGIMIIGAGVAGLSAGWQLGKQGYSDYLTLELAAHPGGNALSGQNTVSAYPWGAHYVPSPPPEATYAHQLFKELGIQTGADEHGRPIYDERYACYAPESRVFYRGKWYEGLYLRAGASKDDLKQLDSFNHLLESWKYRRGTDGKRAFAIPLEMSSRDVEFLALDAIPFHLFLDQLGLQSPRLRWLVNYAMRDDYCATTEQVSAWAGLHYFCSRIVHSNPKLDREPTTLTWPQGNGFLVQGLYQPQKQQVKTRRLVFNIAPNGDFVEISALNLTSLEVEGYRCKQAIFAAPAFVGERVIAPLRDAPRSALKELHYGPWMVANLTVDERLRGHGAHPAWDNVLYEGKGVGYVTATHQHARYQGPAVMSYYYPMTESDPRAARKTLLKTNWEEWTNFIIRDLTPAHPDLKKHLKQVDVIRWGHPMIRPRVGHLWGGIRDALAKPIGPIHFAHSDLSIPLFEEAQYHGVKAALACLDHLGEAR